MKENRTCGAPFGSLGTVSLGMRLQLQRYRNQGGEVPGSEIGTSIGTSVQHCKP